MRGKTSMENNAIYLKYFPSIKGLSRVRLVETRPIELTIIIASAGRELYTYHQSLQAIYLFHRQEVSSLLTNVRTFIQT